MTIDDINCELERESVTSVWFLATLGDVRRDRGGVRRLLELLLAIDPQQLHAHVRLLHLVHLRRGARKSDQLGLTQGKKI